MNAHPTPYPELNAVLHELVAAVHATLGERVMAIYLQGSFAVGDFDEHSDVDFLVVVRSELTDDQLQDLQTMHGRLYELDCDWAKHLEGSYFPRALLNQPAGVGVQPLWFLDNGSRSLVSDVHCNKWVVRWMVREHGIALFGQEADALFEPVPAAALRDEILAKMQACAELIASKEWELDNRWDQPYAVLSFCRMLETLATGEVRSKLSAVRWAIEHLDGRWAGLVQRAWDDRPDPSAKCRLPVDPDEVLMTREFVAYAIAASQRFAV